MKTKDTLTIPVKIDKNDICSMLVSVAETGACNYWIRQITVKFTKGVKPFDFADDGKYWSILKKYDSLFYAAMFVPNCGWEITDDEDGKKHFLTLEKIKKGLSVMANKYPHHLRDIISDNTDSITADVLVQCSLFGEIQYS